MMALVLTLGCFPATYTDVSDRSEFERLVGRRYRLIVPMYLYGVNQRSEYGEEIDFYIIGPTSIPWGGSEVIKRDDLDVDTVLTIQGVIECCFGTTTFALVAIPSYAVAIDVPIRFNVKYLDDSYAEEY